MTRMRLKLLEDRPGSAPQIDHLFERDKVYAQMREVIEAAIMRLRRQRSHSPPPTYVFALLGRHGHGKSSIIEELRKRDFPEARMLNASGEDREDLLENFDYLFANPIPTIFLLEITVFGIIFFSYFVFFHKQDISNAALASGALLLFMLVHLRPFFRRIMRHFRLWKMDRLKEEWRWFRQELLVSCKPGKEPDGANLVIIDDLDRATPEQQKAILLGLRRYRGHLGKVFLISFDEEPLLTHHEDDADPGELMVRTFDATWRLAPMTIMDAADMAISLTNELCKLNPHHWPARFLGDVQVRGDIARALFLHGTASVRFARKMMNNLLLDVARMRPPDVGDISALIRLHGLFYHVPVLETDMDIVAYRFLHHEEDRLLDDIEQMLRQPLRGDKRQALAYYLERTRHMAPHDLNWRKSLRIKSRTRQQHPPDWTPVIFPAPEDRYWCMWDAYLASETDPDERHRHYMELIKKRSLEPPPPIDEEKLPRMESGHCHADDGDRHEGTLYWRLWRRPLVLRLMMMDREVIQRLSDAEVRYIVEEYQKATRLINHVQRRSGRKFGHAMPSAVMQFFS